MSNRKIMLFGYWENNLGDDLFLKVFTDLYPDFQVYLLTKKRFKKFYSSKNIKVVISDSFIYRAVNKLLNFFNLPDLYYFITPFKSNTFVCLGGSLFMESSNWNKQIKNLNFAIEKCKNSFVIGSNFGPYNSQGFYNIYQRLFARMTSICLRDRYSYNLFSGLPNIRFAPDVVFNLDYKDIGQNKYSLGDYYVISVIDLENRLELKKYKKSYEKKVAEVALDIIANGSNIVLMSFCDKEGDIDSIKNIESLLKGNESQVMVYSHTDINDSLNIIYNSKGIIATRLHAMILAFLFNKPVFPIVYSLKMEHVINDYSFKNKYTSVNNIETLDAKEVYGYLQNAPNIPKNVIETAREQFKDIEKTIYNPKLRK